MHMHVCVGCTHQNETNQVFAQFESLYVCHASHMELSEQFFCVDTDKNKHTDTLRATCDSLPLYSIATLVTGRERS